MIGVGRAVEIIQVAGGAGSAVQAVVAVYVALRTLQRHVRPGQCETGRCVIESCIRPGHSRVAGVAGLRKPGLGVIRIRRGLVILQVTGGAGAAVQSIVAVYVALRTGQRDVRPGQCESGGSVVESSASPGRGAMATLAGLRKRSLHVVGIGGALIVLQVA